MRLMFVRPHNSITETPNNDEVGDFIVLSGPNGSGKSNLLEALQQGALTIKDVPAGPSAAVRLFKLAELVAVAEGAQPASNFRDTWLSLANNVQSIVQQYSAPPNSLPRGSRELEEYLKTVVLDNRWMTRRALDQLLATTQKGLSEMTFDDFRRSGPLMFGVKDPFQIGVGEIFLTYSGHRSRNQFLQWLRDEKGQLEVTPLSDEQFERRHGPPPWDLLNETLNMMALPYKFDAPPLEEDATYQPVLTDLDTGVLVRTDQLSSGEKALLAIALTLYTGSRLGDVVELPEILLLDEADASLHPSMAQNLLRIIEEVFVQQYGVKVILTTHSPTTVALAPEETLYVMRRLKTPRLKRASRDEALNALSVGLSTLSVKLENRRQVFVESEYDEEYYQEIYRLARDKVGSEISLQFIASGKRGQGNSVAVNHLVGELRRTGNDTVFGILDRDTRTSTDSWIVFSPERYAIENFVLDPVIVGAFLLRERLVDPIALNLPADTRHIDLDASHAQALADAIAPKVLSDNEDMTPTPCSYVGEFVCHVPRGYLDLPGHDLQQRLVEAYPQLKRYGPNLLREIISKGFGDLVQYIPNELVRLFREISV